MPVHVLRFVLTRDDPETVTQFADSAKKLVELNIASQKFDYIKGKKPWRHWETLYTWFAVGSGFIGCVLCLSAVVAEEPLPAGFGADFIAIAWILTKKSGALYAAKYLIENSPLPSDKPEPPAALPVESPKLNKSPSSGAEQVAAEAESSTVDTAAASPRRTSPRKRVRNAAPSTVTQP